MNGLTRLTTRAEKNSQVQLGAGKVACSAGAVAPHKTESTHRELSACLMNALAVLA